jgi:hypothetical protein
MARRNKPMRDPPVVTCEDCERAMTFTTVKLERNKPSKLNVFYTC